MKYLQKEGVGPCGIPKLWKTCTSSIIMHRMDISLSTFNVTIGKEIWVRLEKLVDKIFTITKKNFKYMIKIMIGITVTKNKND